MTTLVRRRHSRATLRIVAYMEIEPGIGAIILNVSQAGLCFQSVAPVGSENPLRFSFKERDRQMPGSGELVWTDPRRKCGGLRFTDLSAQARAQVDLWLAEVRSEDTDPADLPGEVTHAPLNAAKLRLRLRALAPFPSRMRLAITGGGFSTGLLAGLLISIVTTSVLLLGYAYRSQFGDALVRVGERLRAHSKVESAAAKPASAIPAQIQSAATAPDSAPADPLAATHSPSEAQPAGPPPEEEATDVVVKHSPPSEPSAAANNAASGTVADSAETRQPEPKPDLVPTRRPAPFDVPDQRRLALTFPPVLKTPATALPAFSFAPTGGVARPATAVGVSPAAQDSSSLQMYFDLGKFNEEMRARALKEEVAQLGLRATVLKRGFLWKTSYQVLVGPYNDEREETSIRSELVSRGYEPRPFERGSRRFQFRSRLNLNGTSLPVEESFTITWESYVENATVRFTKDEGVLATVRGRWVQNPYKYSRNEYVYANAGSRKSLLEIHFAGLNRALVFGE